MIRDKLFGQDTVQRVLLGQIASRRLSHAYLFIGPRGVGKRTAARAFAMAVNCPCRDGACSCQPCSLAPEPVHPDVRVIAADNGSIKLQQVKATIAEAALTPNQGPYRIFVIEEAERMTREAANALLLTLEDPKPSAMFILTASSPLLPTIHSRCQVVQFHRQSSESEAGQDAEAVFSLLKQIMQAHPGDRRRFVAEIESFPDGPSLFLCTMLDLLRDLLVVAVGRQGGYCTDLPTVERFRSLLPSEADRLAERCQLLIDAQRMYAANVNRQALFEHLLFSL